MPWRSCFPEQYGVSAEILSIGGRVPSRITNALVRMFFSAPVGVGARAAGTSTASRMQRWTVAMPMRNPPPGWAQVSPHRG
ncbi:hypothetical protein ACVWXU_000380 [Streptomyces sp. TE33382]